MPKNLGLYDNTLSVPRKKDIDAVQDTVDMHDSDIQQLETDVSGLNTEVGAVKTALTSKQDVITGAGSTITENNLTANRALISNSSGKVAVSDITTTQLDYLKNPVTSVNGQTGAVTVEAELPSNIVQYNSLSPVEATTPVNADTLQGHAADYFATKTALDTTNNNLSTLSNEVDEINNNLTNVVAQQVAGKLDKSGGTMTGALIAQSNTNYTTAQVRNVIISPNEPTSSDGNNGDIWIKYME